MPAAVQELWLSLSRMPLVRHLIREQPPRWSPDEGDDIPLRLPPLEDGEPTAEEINAQERDRADRFRCDQLLPIMGIAGQPC